jgi:molybdenum cofactor biosynthesis enzyme MoaA
MTLDCNLQCEYCCNKLETVYSRFIRKSFNEIDFSLYQKVCLTGGEPFINKKVLYAIINNIPRSKDIYIYTNGLLIIYNDILKLQEVNNLKGVNIGLHSFDQLRLITRMVKYLPVRYLAQQEHVWEFLQRYPHQLNQQNLKGYNLNECSRPNEDWVLLK